MDWTRQKIEASIRDRKRTHLRFLENSRAYPHLLELEKAAFSEGALPVKVKELMALAISIATKCEPCIEWHTQQALEAGATDADLFETIDVAMEMGGGPAQAYARYALVVLDVHRERRKTGDRT